MEMLWANSRLCLILVVLLVPPLPLSGEPAVSTADTGGDDDPCLSVFDCDSIMSLIKNKDKLPEEAKVCAY